MIFEVIVGDNQIFYAVIRKERVYWFCGSGFPAAIVLIRGWKAAPTGVLFSNLGLPDKRNISYCHNETVELFQFSPVEPVAYEWS